MSLTAAPTATNGIQPQQQLTAAAPTTTANGNSTNATTTVANPNSNTTGVQPLQQPLQQQQPSIITTTAPTTTANGNSTSSVQPQQPQQQLTAAAPTTNSVQQQRPSTTPTIPVYPYQNQIPYLYPYQNQIQNPSTQQLTPSSPGNVQTQQQPIANAGAPQTVIENSIVILNGRASYDPGGGNIIGYEWKQLPTRDSIPVFLSGANTATPTFTVPVLPADNVILAFSLRVMNSHSIVSTNPAIAYVLVKHSSTGQVNTNTGPLKTIPFG
jgi:hypothetical protein